MISLLLLWPLLYEWYQTEQASHDLRVLEVTVPNRKELLADPIYGVTVFPPARDYLTLELTGHAITDKIKLDYVQVRLHEIEANADHIHGINIHFTDSAKYSSLVKAVDILLNKTNTIRWLWWKKDIWCLMPSPQPANIPAPILPFCGTSYMTHSIPIEKPMDKTFDLFKSYWPVAITFSGLLLCGAFFISRLWPAPLKRIRMFTESRG